MGALIKTALAFVAPWASAALAVLESVWAYIKRPPGSYIAFGFAALVALWIFGRVGYSRGESATQAACDKTISAMVESGHATVATDIAARHEPTVTANTDDAYRAGYLDGLRAATPKEVIRYVPTKIADACVPNGIVKLLDASGLAIADPDSLPGAADEPNEACSGVSVSQAVTLLRGALLDRADFASRLENARQWADAQVALNEAL